MVNLSEKIAQYVVTETYETIPEQVKVLARHSFVDALGCMIAGAKEETPGMVLEYVKTLGGTPEATVVGQNYKTSLEFAARVNGVAGHVLDFDDMSVSFIGHPSVVVLPTVLTLGEKYHITGKQALEAFIIGVEVCATMGRAANPDHYQKGFHPTSSIGLFGATAAAAKIMGLSKQQIIYALGTAASETAALRQNFGTMTKSLHAGSTAAKAIMCATLAAKGLTSNTEILQEDGSFFSVFVGDKSKVAKAAERIANPYEFMEPGLTLKRYPVCGPASNGIDAMLHLAEEYDLQAEDVERIEVGVLPIHIDGLIYPEAKTGLEGKFSMNYCLAVALIDRAVELDHFSDEMVMDQRRQETMKKVHMSLDPSLAHLGYRSTANTNLKVIMKDGTTYSEYCPVAKGTAELPLTEEEVFQKYRSCAMRTLSLERVEQSATMLKTLEGLTDMAELMDVLQ